MYFSAEIPDQMLLQEEEVLDGAEQDDRSGDVAGPEGE